ncbi:hypothetical protein DL98DRAFT_580148 [Cadophora sp. DSE1049]|nr:hypothetical protein DL98DRAFT_580148 [Cadophora sp. DSE1049]
MPPLTEHQSQHMGRPRELVEMEVGVEAEVCRRAQGLMYGLSIFEKLNVVGNGSKSLMVVKTSESVGRKSPRVGELPNDNRLRVPRASSTSSAILSSQLNPTPTFIQEWYFSPHLPVGTNASFLEPEQQRQRQSCEQ